MKIRILILVTIFISLSIQAQNSVKDFGKIFPVEKPDLLLEKNKVYKVIFDVFKDSKKKSKKNPSIITVARYINMHLQQGLSLENLKISWNNSNALLADATKEQLFQMCSKNGLNDQYVTWNGFPTINSSIINNSTSRARTALIPGIGSVACIEFGTDIGLNPGEAPGSIGTYNLQVTMGFKNLTGGSFVAGELEMVLITSIPGVFTIF